MIKIVASDLDGTLFYPKRKINMVTKKNAAFFRDFYKAGGSIVLVTGRSRRIPMKVEKKVKVPISVLGCNGAFVYEDGIFKNSYPIERETLMKIYIQLRANFGIIGWLIFDETDQIKVAATNTGNWVPMIAAFLNMFNLSYSEKYVFSEQAVFDSIAKGTVYKIMPIFGLNKAAKEKASAASVALSDLYKDKLTVVKAGICLEITSVGVTKANTLKEFIKNKGVKEDEVAVVGDSYNDVPLFEAFKNSFIMASGEKDIQSKAAHVVNRVSDLRPFVLDDDNRLLP